MLYVTCDYSESFMHHFKFAVFSSGHIIVVVVELAVVVVVEHVSNHCPLYSYSDWGEKITGYVFRCDKKDCA